MLLALASLSALVSGCGHARPALPTPRGDRIVSADYCADLAITALVPPGRVAALSPEIADHELPRAYRAIPRTRPRIETLVALRPTLVVQSYGGGPRLSAALDRAGLPVLDLASPQSLDGVDRELERLGAKLSAQDRADRWRGELARLRALPRPRVARTALYMTPGSVTSGSDGLIGDMFREAGLSSVEQRPGWHALPVERLIRDKPDLVVRAFFGDRRYRQDRWSPAHRPALQAALRGVPTVSLDARSVACGTAHTIDALRKLKAAT